MGNWEKWVVVFWGGVNNERLALSFFYMGSTNPWIKDLYLFSAGWLMVGVLVEVEGVGSQ